jgi:hypothetical protein
MLWRTRLMNPSARFSVLQRRVVCQFARLGEGNPFGENVTDHRGAERSYRCEDGIAPPQPAREHEGREDPVIHRQTDHLKRAVEERLREWRPHPSRCEGQCRGSSQVQKKAVAMATARARNGLQFAPCTKATRMPNSMVKPSDPTITNLTASLRKKPVRSASSLAARSRALNPIRRTMLNFQESSKFRIGQTGAGGETGRY